MKGTKGEARSKAKASETTVKRRVKRGQAIPILLAKAGAVACGGHKTAQCRKL